MPRPRKYRRVCGIPQTVAFGPVERRGNTDSIALTIDEYETIRLIDREGFSQEACGEQMEIARTTVQMIYASARKKVADALVEGRTLLIGGGDYLVCGGESCAVGCAGCTKREQHLREMEKEEPIVRIAIPYEKGQVFQHFGRTEQFKIYDVRKGSVVSDAIVDTDGEGHGALAGILRGMKVEILICGGIGGGARAALDAAGIQLIGGVSGSADRAVQAFLSGVLENDPDYQCTHHENGHGHHHDCGDHSCHGGTCKH